LAVASRRRLRIYQQLLRRLNLRHKTSAWASGALHRARHRSSRVAVASLRLFGAAAAIFFSRFRVFFVFFTYN
jgi:hypothetical protein